jgi:cytochrome c-type biogenesis protein
MILFGLRALGALRAPFLDYDLRPALARVQLGGGGLFAAFLFGAAFALGWSPCVGPLLASALAYAAVHGDTPWRGAGLLSVYAAGLAVPLVLVAALAERAKGWLRLSHSWIPVFERATGVFLIGMGVWTLHGIRASLVRSRRAAETAACPTETENLGCALPSKADAVAATPDLTGPRLIEFVSAECPVCRKMAPVLAQAELRCLGVGANATQIDVGTVGGLSLARRFGVVGTPTFVLLGEDDIERARIVGEQPSSKIESAIEAAFGMRCAMQTSAPALSGYEVQRVFARPQGFAVVNGTSRRLGERARGVPGV